jgi:hypothetical protein
MHGVTIRNRTDGVTELSPRIAPLDREERALVIVTVLMAASAFFVSGVLPIAVLAALLAACIAGELVLGVKALVLALRRPLADVHEVAHTHLRPR